MDRDTEIRFRLEARIANERQNAPSNRACSSKICSVIFRHDSAQRTNEVPSSLSFRS
jgi:hypothetical protein